MGLGGDVLCWMEETGFQGSFMDAWEAYGNGDDIRVRSPLESESESESGIEPRSEDDDFTQHNGFLTRGGDLLVATMTETEAVRKATELVHCKGFCFRRSPDGSAGPVEVFFKSKWDLKYDSQQKWTSFRKVHFFQPTEVIILKSSGRLSAGEIYFVTGETPEWRHSMHWEIQETSYGPDSSQCIAKRDCGSLWVEHDELPFQVRMLRTKYGLNAGEVRWVQGETRDGECLLLEGSYEVPRFVANVWEEVRAVDMQNERKLSLLSAIEVAGSTKAWRAIYKGSDSASTSAGPVQQAMPLGWATGRSVNCAHVHCSQCGLNKAADAFSRNQRRYPRSLRRCKVCVASRQ